MDWNCLSDEQKKIVEAYGRRVIRSRNRLRFLCDILKPKEYIFKKKQDSYTYLYEPNYQDYSHNHYPHLVDCIDILIAFVNKEYEQNVTQDDHKYIITFLANKFDIKDCKIKYNSHNNELMVFESEDKKYYEADKFYSCAMAYLIKKYRKEFKLL